MSARAIVSVALLLLFSTSSTKAAVDAIGYKRVPLAPGFTLVSNPLIAESNTFHALFAKNEELNDGFAVFSYRNGTFEKGEWNAAERRFMPEEFGTRELLPGESVFVYNPNPSAVTFTFVGTVLLGTVVNPIPKGWAYLSSKSIRTGSVDELAFPASAGDLIYQWDSRTQFWLVSYFDELDNRWQPAPPVLNPGEGIIVFKREAADWVQEVKLME